MSLHQRYDRQITFEHFGLKGQKRLAASRVLVCGVGALGSTICNSLGRAGVGFLRLIDDDRVDLTNLHRQMLYDEKDAEASELKVNAVRNHMQQINSEVQVEAHVGRLTESNADQLLDGIDLIMDGTDNFTTRMLLNRLAVAKNIPWIYGGVLGTQGRVMPVLPGVTACLACILQTVPDDAEGPTIVDVGVLGPIVEQTAAVEVIEALKILSGRTNAVMRSMLLVDMWRGRYSTLPTHRRTDHDDLCPVCGQL